MQDTKQNTAAGGQFSDRAAAQRAVAIALPMLERAVEDSTLGKSGFLYIVIMDPTLPPGDAEFSDAILYEHAIGDPQQWEADYAKFARDKARVCWRTGVDGHTVRHVVPHLLHKGDTGIWGAVCIEGITVGVSGADPWFDEAFAATIAHCFKAVAKERAMATPEAPAFD